MLTIIFSLSTLLSSFAYWAGVILPNQIEQNSHIGIGEWVYYRAVSTVADFLDAISKGENIQLTQDIDFNAAGKSPMVPIANYIGKFDGGGYTIKNLIIKPTNNSADDVGLFA